MEEAVKVSTENKEPQTELDLVSKVLELFPHAVIDDDNGEIIIRTKLSSNQDGTLSPVGGP